MTRMDRSSLFQMIRSDPENLDLWSVYGDLLQVEGDFRGELIAIDIALKKAGDRTQEIEIELQQRRYKVIRKYERALAKQTGGYGDLEWHLGYLRKVCINKIESLQTLWDHDLLPFPFTLDLSNCWSIDSSKAELFSSSPVWKRVMSLKLGPGSLDILTTSPNTAELTILDLSDINIVPSGLEILASSSILRSIDELNLSNNHIGQMGVDMLLSSHNIARLKSLTLRGNDIGSAGLKSLSISTHLPNLMTLDLSSNLVEKHGVEALASSSNYSHLKSLNLSNNSFGNDGVEYLAISSNLKDITNLNLAYNSIDDTGIEALSLSSNFANLLEVDLSTNDIRYFGIEAFARSPYLKKVPVQWVNPTPS